MSYIILILKSSKIYIIHTGKIDSFYKLNYAVCACVCVSTVCGRGFLSVKCVGDICVYGGGAVQVTVFAFKLLSIYNI